MVRCISCKERAVGLRFIFISLVSVVLPNFICLIRLNVANRSLFSAQSTEATRPTQSGRNVA